MATEDPQVTRDQLAEFIPKHDTIIQFELLFDLVLELQERIEALEAAP